MKQREFWKTNLIRGADGARARIVIWNGGDIRPADIEDLWRRGEFAETPVMAGERAKQRADIGSLYGKLWEMFSRGVSNVLVICRTHALYRAAIREAMDQPHSQWMQ